MKTAREWFQCLRQDLRDRAIKATEESPLRQDGLNHIFHKFSHALHQSFEYAREGNKEYNILTHRFWYSIYNEARDIEEGRKPDIKK